MEQAIVKAGTNAVAQRDSAPLPEDMDVFRLGAALAASGYFKDVRNEAQAVAKILAGRELGFGPSASLMGIYIVDGKPTMAANLIAAAIKKSGRYDFRVKRLDNEACELMFIEKIAGVWEEVGPSTFTMKDAQTAGLSDRDVWKKYTRNMLFSRALTNGARWFCATVFVTGIYTPDELSDEFVLNDDGTTYRRVGAPSQDTTPASAVADQIEASNPAVAKARELASGRTAKRAEKATPQTAPEPAPQTPPAVISKQEGRDLVALAESCGWSVDDLRIWLAERGVASLADIAAADFPDICRFINENPPPVKPSQVATDDEGRVIA